VVGALKEVGIAAVLAESIDPIFQRDAIDGGLPALVCPGLDGEVADGDVLELDLRSGTGSNVTRDVGISVKPCPPLLADILDAGGSMPWTVIREKGVRDQAAEREP
jgi:3-isopropylmalate/(R)-2-methylmalate dehydratase small subunit